MTPPWHPDLFSLAWTSATLFAFWAACPLAGFSRAVQLLPWRIPVLPPWRTPVLLPCSRLFSGLPQEIVQIFKTNKTGTQSSTQGLSTLVLASSMWNFILRMNQALLSPSLYSGCLSNTTTPASSGSCGNSISLKISSLTKFLYGLLVPGPSSVEFILFYGNGPLITSFLSDCYNLCRWV